MRCAGHVVHVEDVKERIARRPRRRWEDSIRMDLREIHCEVVE